MHPSDYSLVPRYAAPTVASAVTIYEAKLRQARAREESAAGQRARAEREKDQWRTNKKWSKTRSKDEPTPSFARSTSAAKTRERATSVKRDALDPGNKRKSSQESEQYQLNQKWLDEYRKRDRDKDGDSSPRYATPTTATRTLATYTPP